MPGPMRERLGLSPPHVPDDPRWNSHDHLPCRNRRALGHKTSGGDHSALADRRVRQNDRADPNDRPIPHPAAVEIRVVPDGDVLSNLEWSIMINVENGPILNVRALADGYLVNVAAQDGVIPNACVFGETASPDYKGAAGDECAGMNARFELKKRNEHPRDPTASRRRAQGPPLEISGRAFAPWPASCGGSRGRASHEDCIFYPSVPPKLTFFCLCCGAPFPNNACGGAWPSNHAGFP